jgi:hypothetical protein
MVAQYYTPTPSSFSGSQGRQTSIPNAVPPNFDLKQSVAALTESVNLLKKQHIALRRVLRSYDHVSPEALSEWSALIKVKSRSDFIGTSISNVITAMEW